jgi:hypothetical protein
VGSYSVAPDRWLWFHGAWFRQVVQGPRRIRRYPAHVNCACATFHGVVDHTDRAARRLSNTSRRLCVLCQFADGRAFVGGYFYCASALRVQFDQAHSRDRCRGAVWTTGL